MRSSETIAQLAGALARAQVELVNPPKSLTATIEPGSGRGGQSYRYAPLSAGLDIIRRALGQQEIALLQTTTTEPEGTSPSAERMLVLTTTLAHASGEWVATTWPVCRLGDVSDPKLLGAALTYARRYSLFALVGITGEDDLDAPELGGEAARRLRSRGEELRISPPAGSMPVRHRSRADQPLSRVRTRVAGATQAQAPVPAGADGFASPASASDLLASLEAVEDEAALLLWARDILPVRSTLDETDRIALDQAFLRRAETIGADPELLSAFTPPHESVGQNPVPGSLNPTPTLGGHDAQAAV
jgi:hypothetical protein